MMRISNPIAAYWFDETAMWFATFIDSKLSEKFKSGRPKYQLSQLLGVYDT